MLPAAQRHELAPSHVPSDHDREIEVLREIRRRAALWAGGEVGPRGNCSVRFSCTCLALAAVHQLGRNRRQYGLYNHMPQSRPRAPSARMAQQQRAENRGKAAEGQHPGEDGGVEQRARRFERGEDAGERSD
jgi:hypothetical protein